MNRLVFLGAGRMASAMVNGMLRTKAALPQEISCTSADDGTGPLLAQQTGIRYSNEPSLLLRNADVVVLAFKPQQLKDIPQDFSDLTKDRLVISILAGSTLQRLQQKFPHARNIVRAMPNTPGQIGAGITAYAALSPLSAEDQNVVIMVLGSLGNVLALPESQLDAVTGLSGSGPAYVFEFIAALRDGGIAAGLDADVAYNLALETVLGAAKLLKAVPHPPETHRDWVTSPNGTTLAGLGVMSQHGFREVVKDTVLAATKRSRELAG